MGRKMTDAEREERARRRKLGQELRAALRETDLYQYIGKNFSDAELEQPIIRFFSSHRFRLKEIVRARAASDLGQEDRMRRLFPECFSGRENPLDWEGYFDIFRSGCAEEIAVRTLDRLLEEMPGLKAVFSAHPSEEEDLRDILLTRIRKEAEDYYIDQIEPYYGWNDIMDLIRAGDWPNAAMEFDRRAEVVRKRKDKRKRREQELERKILTRMPDRYIDLFPEARRMRRHFIIRVGPTNSGKTYHALRDFMAARSGIYLGPLRLLAHEVYETCSEAGVPCNMITGEEEVLTDGALHTASTVEMLDLRASYECAVIDEAQLLADPERGAAWTNAIAGVQADRVHVLAAPEALGLIRQLVETCGDTFEIIRTERMTPLAEDRSFRHFPEDVQKSDALVVFSRRDVHACAAELRARGIRPSIIYGALPYQVRKNEVRKFLDGTTEVVVATDAIGMGMNLPIRRVVFLETEKFDGRERRRLYPEEFRQIAGRAGRRGMFEKGYYASANDDVELKGLARKIKKAPISFPETLLEIDAPMTDLAARWNALPHQGVFRISKIDMELCSMLARQTGDKKLIFDFLTLPVDSGDRDLLDLWYQLFHLELNWEAGFSDQRLAAICQIRIGGLPLVKLEEAHRRCDLLYSYARKFNHADVKPGLMRTRARISQAIMKNLDKQAFAVRTCRVCGRPLPWNYRFRICQDCYERGRR